MAKVLCDDCMKEKDYPRYECPDCGSSYCEDCAEEYDFCCSSCEPPELEKIESQDD